MKHHQSAIFTALLAAALFGATTPLAKALLGTLPPFMVAVMLERDAIFNPLCLVEEAGIRLDAH